MAGDTQHLLEIIYEALNDAGMIETTQDAEYAAEKVRSAVVAALYTPPASPAEPEEKGACPVCGCEEVDHRNLWTCRCPAPAPGFKTVDPGRPYYATPPATPADMAAFGASDAACYLYPGADQQTERAAFCEGAAHAASTPPASPAATDEEVTKVVGRLERWVKMWGFRSDELGVALTDMMAAADLLARVAKERDEAIATRETALVMLQTAKEELAAAEKVLRDIVWFDWSDNDDDAVAAIDRARAALAAMEACDE